MPFDPTKPRSRDEVLLQAIVSGDSSAMGDPRDREEEFVKAIADKETLPDHSEASEGDVLQIGTDGPEWGSVDALPDYSGASAGDALVIGNDGPEWGAIPNELPAIAAGDAGKVLKVNSGETGVEWGTAGGGTKYVHNIRITKNLGSQSAQDYVEISVSIITESNTPITSMTAFNTEIQRLVGSNPIMASGSRFDRSSSPYTIYNITRIYNSTGFYYGFTSQGYQIVNGEFSSMNDGTTHNLGSATVNDVIYSI